jgi:YVTN family beta-propeller protein
MRALAPTAVLALSLLPLVAESAAAQSFVNWESPHVHPLDLAPGGRKLMAVNTPGGRLEVFDTQGGTLALTHSIPVGLDPVSVRARSSREAWVVNHVSDSVSVVDLRTGRVRATLATDDEPCDVVFAGAPARAFVSCSQANTVLVFDPSDLDAAPQRIAIAGEEPRALAVSADGATVYAAVFESGNASTVLAGGSLVVGGSPPNVVSDPAGPYGGLNPPPNDGAGFTPAMAPGNPAPPPVGLVVKKNGAGQWMDDNGGDWTALVSGASAAASGRVAGWDLPDHDVARIDAANLGVSYVSGLMNLCMALGVNPADGTLSVVGTDATNEVRFEPNLTGVFLRVELALVPTSGAPAVVDLNPHLDYLSSNVAQALRDESLGDPRGVVWNAAGSRAYVSGMGSNNVVVLDAAGARNGIAPTIEVGEGPTGLALDDAAGRLYVLNKFESSVSVVDTATELETSRTGFHDPEPAAIKDGRVHLYGTHESSGLGQIACASCHVDARMDRLVWDLGDPSGSVKPLGSTNCPDGGCQDWHPMKGPMLTQTMQDIIGKEPHHWRGDRTGLEEFAGAFVSLQGDDANLGPGDMQEFEDFLATIYFPPNPYRNLDNTLPTAVELTGHTTPGRFAPAGQPLGVGDAQRGLALYRPPNTLDGVACVTCHTLPTGLGPDGTLTPFFTHLPPRPNGERHHALVSDDQQTNVSIKVPQLRNLYERVGFDFTKTDSTSGAGFVHDGSVDSLARFVAEPLFNVQSDQDIADLVAFMLAFSGSDLPSGAPFNLLEPPGSSSNDTHAAVGTQVTLTSTAPDPDDVALLTSLLALADAGDIGLVAKARRRGFAYLGSGQYQSDRASETATSAELFARAGFGSELTWTAVPAGAETRVAVDRDEDGAFDLDELEAGSDPADGASTPAACGASLPSAPTDLEAERAQRRVRLTWTDASADEQLFTVERSELGAGAWTLVGTRPANATSFVDRAVACSKQYRYRVRASNCAGVSTPASATGSALPCEDRDAKD